MSDVKEIIGKRIRAYRENAHVSRETLAERADIHPTYLGQLERGEKNATMESLSKVAKGLEIPMEYLVENITGTAQQSTVAADCYNLIVAQSIEDQKKLYRILQEIISYKKGQPR